MNSSELTMSDANFAKLRGIVHDNTGITIGETRKTMLLSRLRGRLRETKDTSFNSYIARLNKDPDEMQELINRVTTNKTYCYRTPRTWEHFESKTVPHFQSK